MRPALLGDLRGRSYDVVYLGYGADGRIGRLNLTASLYAALGRDRNSIFTSRPARIRAGLAAAELSYDQDWMRFRSRASTRRATAIPMTTSKAASTRSSKTRSSPAPIPATGSARRFRSRAAGARSRSTAATASQFAALVKGRRAVEFQQPRHDPGRRGGDFDLSPEMRVSTNFNHLWFQDTATLQVLRSEGSIPTDIGWDLSVAGIWRPKATQNIVGRLSAAVLLPARGSGTCSKTRRGTMPMSRSSPIWC